MRVLPPTAPRSYRNPLAHGKPAARPARASTRMQSREMLYEDHYGGRISRRRQFPIWVRWSMVIVAILLVAQSFFQLPFLSLTTIQVNGERYLTENEIRLVVERQLSRRRFIIFKNSNFFLVSLPRLRSVLEESLYVRVTQLSKKFPRTLIIDIDERISAFVLQTPDRFIALDRRGDWLGAVSGPTEQQTVIVDNRSAPGSTLALEYLEKATSVKEEWERSIATPKIAKLYATDDPSTLELSTDKNYRVLFHTDKDIHTQIERLVIFLADESATQPREYIDLRFDESLFVK